MRSRFLRELHRRKVFRVAAAYAVVGWLLAQAGSIAFATFGVPDWVGKAWLVLLLLGFPLALVLAWAFDITPAGVRRAPEEDIATPPTRLARGIDFAIIGVLAVLSGWLWLDRQAEPALAKAVSVAERPTLAALPFANRGSDEDSAIFADGLHDDLLTQLARIGGLHVVSRTSVMEYRDTRKNLRDIGRELGVRYIVEGGVQKTGNRVRVNVQLIDAHSDAHLWADSYDRELTVENLFEIQGEVAQRVAIALHAAVSPDLFARLTEPPTKDINAYRDYLSAIVSEPFVRFEDYWPVIESLERAVEKDPLFALAWARLVKAYVNQYWFTPEQAELTKRARMALVQAESLQPDLHELHAARGMYFYAVEEDFDRALMEFQRAEQLMPSDDEVIANQCYVFRRLGRFDEELNCFERAFRLNPRSPERVYDLASSYIYFHRYTEARKVYRRALDLGVANSLFLRSQLAHVDFLTTGDIRPAFELLLPVEAEENETIAISLVIFGWMLGEFELALDMLHRLRITGVSSRFLYADSEELRAYLLDGLGDASARQVFAGALERYSSLIEQNPDDVRYVEALARVQSALGLKQEALANLEKARAMIDRRYARDISGRVFALSNNAMFVCAAGDTDTAERMMRELLSRPSMESHLSFVYNWPPCRDRMLGTSGFERLDREFEHLVRR